MTFYRSSTLVAVTTTVLLSTLVGFIAYANPFVGVFCAVPLYFGVATMFGHTTYLDDRIIKSKPFHFLRSRRRRIYMYEDILKVKLTYVRGEHGIGYYIDFIFKRRDESLTQGVSEYEPRKIIALLSFFIEKKIPVFVVNETTFLKRINRDLKKMLDVEIQASQKISGQHVFHFLQNDEEKSNS